MRNRMVAVLVVAFLAVGLAWAGGGEKGKHDPDAIAAKYQAKLGLTEAQTAQVRTLVSEMHSRWADLKASGQDEAARKEAKKQLKQEYRSRLQSILTEDQFARYEQWMAEYKSKKQARKQD